MEAKRIRYQPARIKPSRIKILYTPMEYLEAGRELMEEMSRQQSLEEEKEREKVATAS